MKNAEILSTTWHQLPPPAQPQPALSITPQPSKPITQYHCTLASQIVQVPQVAIVDHAAPPPSSVSPAVPYCSTGRHDTMPHLLLVRSGLVAPIFLISNTSHLLHEPSYQPHYINSKTFSDRDYYAAQLKKFLLFVP